MIKPPSHQIFRTFQVSICVFNEAQDATCSSNASGNNGDDDDDDDDGDPILHHCQYRYHCHHWHLMIRQVQIEVTDENPAMFNLEWLDVCSEKVRNIMAVVLVVIKDCQGAIQWRSNGRTAKWGDKTIENNNGMIRLSNCSISTYIAFEWLDTFSCGSLNIFYLVHTSYLSPAPPAVPVEKFQIKRANFSF